MKQLDEADDGRHIEATVGELFEVTLRENPTTGYRWQLEQVGAPACTLLEDLYEAASGNIGHEGRHRWRFRAAQVGRANIKLNYARAWAQAPEQSGSQTFSLVVNVLLDSR